MLVNSNLDPDIPASWRVTRPVADAEALAEMGVQLIEADVVDTNRPTRHDSLKLATALIEALVPVRSAVRASGRLAPVMAARALASSIHSLF